MGRREDYTDEEWEDMCERFADPGGNSCLHPETSWDPRIHPCPTCKRPNMLTKRDKQRGYQCDYCADACERGYGY